MHRPLTTLRCIAALTALFAGCTQETVERGDDTGIRFLSQTTNATDFARALTVREFEFPRDHGTHDQYATEWWYFTGNLFAPDGRHFGFELTFFRYALSAQDVQRESRWGTTQSWLAHFAVTDTQADRFHSTERMGRAVAGIAGASADALELQVRDWSAIPNADGSIRLQADAATFAIDLTVAQPEFIMLNGEAGLDQKGSAPGNASYYYSAPRLQTTGRISTPGTESLAVSGTTWLDREWGTSALDPGIEGWDWFALELDDGTSLMLYRLRDAAGNASEFSTGTLALPNQRTMTLSADVLEFAPQRHWRSPITGVRYPVEWQVSIAELQTNLHIRPRIDDQELRLGLRYWEGAVVVEGTHRGRPTSGTGYLELAGY